MFSKTPVVTLTLAVTLLSLLTGCPSIDGRLTNQGGGNIVSAGLKIAQGRMTDLTPDEVQALADKVFEKKPELGDYELGDEEAAAAIDFLVANELDSIDDIQALLEEVNDNPDAVEIPDSVVTLIDAQDVLDEEETEGGDTPDTVPAHDPPGR